MTTILSQKLVEEKIKKKRKTRSFNFRSRCKRVSSHEKDDEETSMIVGAEQMLRLGEGGATRFWSSKALKKLKY